MPSGSAISMWRFERPSGDVMSTSSRLATTSPCCRSARRSSAVRPTFRTSTSSWPPLGSACTRLPSAPPRSLHRPSYQRSKSPKKSPPASVSPRSRTRVQAAPSGGQLEVEVLKVGRTALLRLADLQHGEVVVTRELVDMTSPLGRSKRHIEIALPDGMSYRAGDYLAVLPHNPIGVVMRALKRFDLASDTQIVIRKPEGSITSLPVDHPVNVSELLFHYVELGQPATRAQVTALAAATRAAPEQAELTALAEESAY